MDPELSARFAPVWQAADKARSVVADVCAAPVHGDMVGRYGYFADALQARLSAQDRQLARLESSANARGTNEQPGALTLLQRHYEDLRADAERLRPAAHLLSVGAAAERAWEKESAPALKASEILKGPLAEAVGSAWRDLSAPRDPRAEDVPERARALEQALRDCHDAAARALTLANESLAHGEAAPAEAVTLLAQAQADLSHASDAAVRDVFLPALGLHASTEPRPGFFAFKARAAWNAADERRTRALLAFDEAVDVSPAAVGAASFMDAGSLLDGSLLPVSPSAVRGWWGLMAWARS